MSTTYKLDDYVPSGSSLRGHINASYDALVEAFGEPNILNAEEGDKVWNEWGIEFRVPIEDDGMGDVDDYETINATIYDWKEHGAYDSHLGGYRWHIGGKQVEAVWLVLDALNAPETMTRTDV
jgi:hypothetical protein